MNKEKRKKGFDDEFSYDTSRSDPSFSIKFKDETLNQSN